MLDFKVLSLLLELLFDYGSICMLDLIYVMNIANYSCMK